MEGGGEGPEGLPRRPVAIEHRTALLQLSHHGRTGHALYRDRRSGGIPAVARQIIFEPMDVVDSAARLAVPLHREHGWMDDDRDWTTAVAGLRSYATRGRLFKNSLGRKRHVYPAGFYGHVHSAGNLVSVFGSPRN